MEMGRYTLIVTEKPDAAQRIAEALDANEKPVRMTENHMPYYVAKRDQEIVIVPALGHLYTVAAGANGRNHYPVLNCKWVPAYVAERRAKRTRNWLEAISKLAKDADMFIDACDYDIEGSVIGYNILKHACNGKETEARRMKYSTLTKEELGKSYEKPLPHLDFSLIEAGLTRHEVDWLYGINLSRALTTAAKKHSGTYTTLSTGRVQGPTLKFIAAREETIKTFVPTPYWEIEAQIQIDKQTYETQYEKGKIDTRHEADTVLEACKGKDGQIEQVESKQFPQLPPVPFDLGALQVEAFTQFRYTPKRTSSIAQHLYLDALISYPRTSSQKLPQSINYEAILKGLGKTPEYRELTTRLLTRSVLKPHEGRKDDPAHPAIYPTGKMPQRSLDSSERNIWNLIVRRFMSVFAEPAVRQSVKITINVDGHRFMLTGTRTLTEGWLRFYEPYARLREVVLPQVNEGILVKIKKIIVEDKFTKPPPRYNASTLLRRMENAEIGTKATRADTIQTLYERGYIKDGTMAATDLGFAVLEVLEKHCPTVVSIKLTRELEGRMNDIQTNNEKRENVLAETVEILKPVLEKLKEKEAEIGKQLTDAIRKSRMEERIVGTCPSCKTGKLVILYSRKTGKRFIGCSNYFKGTCKTSFPLPQKGNVRPTSEICQSCGCPTIQVRSKARRPWILCINPLCPSKEGGKKRIAVQDMQ